MGAPGYLEYKAGTIFKTTLPLRVPNVTVTDYVFLRLLDVSITVKNCIHLIFSSRFYLPPVSQIIAGRIAPLC